MGVRSFARGAVERMLLPLAGAARRRPAHARSAAILSYHNVSPDGAGKVGDTSLHLPFHSFLEQIERLTRTHHVVGLDELVEGRRVAREKPLAAITFDDAYRGALTLALPALVDRGLPATIFVAPGLIGEDAFWWDGLASPDGSGLYPGVRKRVLEIERGRSACGKMVDLRLRPDQGPADPEALARAASLPGVSLAPHTWSHPNLTALPSDELEAELERPRTWLRANFADRALENHLAFPYGLWDRRVAAAARAVGYRHLYRVEGGIAQIGRLGTEALPRINVPAGLSGAGFELRVAGLIR